MKKMRTLSTLHTKVDRWRYRPKYGNQNYILLPVWILHCPPKDHTWEGSAPNACCFEKWDLEKEVRSLGCVLGGGIRTLPLPVFLSASWLPQVGGEELLLPCAPRMICCGPGVNAAEPKTRDLNHCGNEPEWACPPAVSWLSWVFHLSDGKSTSFPYNIGKYFYECRIGRFHKQARVSINRNH